MAFFARPQSTAVKIVRPDEPQDEPKTPPVQSRKADNVQRQCRNIVIYGHCKYADKGCIYWHPESPPRNPSAQGQPPRSDSPVKTLTAQAVNAPVFVPKASFPGATSPPLLASTPSVSPHDDIHRETPVPDNGNGELYDNNEDADVDSMTQQYELHGIEYDDQYYASPPFPGEYGQHGHFDPTYYHPSSVYTRQPLDYHLYTPAIPEEFVPSGANGHFVLPSNDLRQLLQARSEAIRGIDTSGQDLPEELQGYHTLVPLEPTGSNAERRKLGNWYSTVYKAINASNGVAFTLRRVEDYRLPHQSAFLSIEKWSQVRHPGIVTVKEAFTTRSFGDSSLVVVYAYYAKAETLFDMYFNNKPTAQYPGRKPVPRSLPPVPERTLWSYIVQISSAIKEAHTRGLSIRTIDLTKILVTGQNRIRISLCGLVDILTFERPTELQIKQQEDLAMLGRLIFSLCTNDSTASTPAHFQRSLDIMSKKYSPDVKNIALFLLNFKGGPLATIDGALNMIHTKILADHDAALTATDRLEHELLGELENARLVRLLCKIGFINERPEFAHEPHWSETGDRYIIKLFRDYVFHQVDEHGKPVLNLSHVLTCLNKLDVGTEEKIMLVARDEQSCLVVTYKEIKSCMEGAFQDLIRNPAAITSSQGYSGPQISYSSGYLR